MAETARRVTIVRDPADGLAGSGPARWAVEQLSAALAGRGIQTDLVGALDQAPTGGPTVLVTGRAAPLARAVASAAGVALPTEPESLALVPGRLDGRDVLLATGSDARGLVYAVLELADRVAHGADPLASLSLERPIVERPASPIRGINKLLVSDVEDLPWFHDRAAWRDYLSMLATQRFNRFHLAFGIGHDFLRNVLDAYLLFPYPFLVDVPGYDVRAVHQPDGAPLPDDERRNNLDTLRFIADEAAARGLHFQLGIWTHQYRWTDSPNATYLIEGLNEENHAAYCRAALRAILVACPSIAGVTLRVHGESGVPEGNYGFWAEVFQGAVDCGRTVELDLHPKGVDRAMIDVALRTGLPTTISPKYWAEHIGLPSHQLQIRPTESARTGREGDAFVEGLMNRSAFELNFTRYGYANFLEEDRPYGVFYRVWPGTQRLLLWGDPALAAGFGREGTLAGCLGVEVMEPLSFKGRRGSGLPGGRDAYADPALRPARDWEKYLYTYRLFGRLLYNPDADPDVWRRYLAHEFGDAADAVEAALAGASRVLPLVTTAYCPSAANNRYWPEIYTNMPIADAGRPHHYRDTVEPKRFGTVSPLDPGLFSRVDDFADQVVAGERSGKYSPLRVAAWLDEAAETATGRLAEAERVADPAAPAFRRLAVDVRIQAALGRFFAAKLRAGLAYALFKRTGERARLHDAVAEYRRARAAWLAAIEHGRAYRDDVTVGGEPWLRGHWADRLPAIAADLADLEAELERAQAGTVPDGGGGSRDVTAARGGAQAYDAGRASAAAMPPLAALDEPALAVEYEHAPPARFERGQSVPIELGVRAPADTGPISVRLHYRHLNQAEGYEVVEMVAEAGRYRAAIPAAYTDSPYPLLYYFELRTGPARAWLYPGLADDLANRAYFVVRQT